MAHGAADLPELFKKLRSKNNERYFKHSLIYGAILIVSVILSVSLDYKYLIFFALLTAYHFGTSDKLAKFELPIWNQL